MITILFFFFGGGGKLAWAFGGGSFYHSNTLDRTLTVNELKIPPEMLVGDTVGSEIQEKQN